MCCAPLHSASCVSGRRGSLLYARASLPEGGRTVYYPALLKLARPYGNVAAKRFAACPQPLLQLLRHVFRLVFDGLDRRGMVYFSPLWCATSIVLSANISNGVDQRHNAIIIYIGYAFKGTIVIALSDVTAADEFSCGRICCIQSISERFSRCTVFHRGKRSVHRTLYVDSGSEQFIAALVFKVAPPGECGEKGNDKCCALKRCVYPVQLHNFLNMLLVPQSVTRDGC